MATSWFANLFKHFKHQLTTRLNLLLLGNKNALRFKDPIDVEAEESKLETAWKRQEEEDRWMTLD